MPFNVNEFKTAIDGLGLMRNNKFLVQFAIPPILNSVVPESNNGQMFSLYCKAAPLPGLGILTQDIYRYGYGPIERRPYGTVVNDIMFHFYIDSANLIRKWFRNWIRMIINPDTSKGMQGTFGLTGQSSYEISYKQDYAVDVRVIAFNAQGVPKISIVLTEAYPNYIGDIHQDWDDKNTNMLMPISLTFRDWYEETVDEDTGSPTAFTQSMMDVSVADNSKPFTPTTTLANVIPSLPGAPLAGSQPTFFNPNVDLDNTGTMPFGVQTPFGVRF